MIKIVALLKRKPGLSREEFIRYYEERHAPLATSLTAMGYDYRRNYPLATRSNGREDGGIPEFDAITEVWFADRAAYEAFNATMSRPDVRALIVEDEAKFMDRAAMRIYTVEEYRSTQTPRTADTGSGG